MTEHITIIGAGNLTMSILEAMKRSRAKFTINVVDIDKKKSSQLKKFGVTLNTTYDDKISKSKLILLIVKPKDYVQALKSINPYVNSQTIIAEIESIAALDIGQPDCKLINPVLIKEDGTFSKFLDTLTNETEMAISSDKILMMLLPKQSVLEEYLKLVR